MRHTDTIYRTTGIGHHMDRAQVSTYESHKQCGDELVTLLDDGDGLVLADLKTYRIGSVIGSALKDGRDPVAALDRARELGHELVFIYGLGAMITAHQRTPEPYIRVKIGQMVMFHGGVYTIQKAPNDNIRLQRYVKATVAA